MHRGEKASFFVLFFFAAPEMGGTADCRQRNMDGVGARGGDDADADLWGDPSCERCQNELQSYVCGMCTVFLCFEIAVDAA